MEILGEFDKVINMGVGFSIFISDIKKKVRKVGKNMDYWNHPIQCQPRKEFTYLASQILAIKVLFKRKIIMNKIHIKDVYCINYESKCWNDH